MNSSTSSSEMVVATPQATRRLYGKVLLVILLGMALAFIGLRIFTAANDASGDTILSRVLQAKAALPQITSEDQDLMMFYGSSMVQAGFSPRQFDSQMLDQGIAIKSFNFGFGGLNPFFQDYLSRRIRDQFEADERRLKLAVLEFNPFQTTQTRWNGAIALEDSFITLLGSNEELWEITRQDPDRGLRLFTIRDLRDGISAEMITTFFLGDAVEVPRPRTTLDEDPEEVANRRNEILEILNERFVEDYPDYDGSDWYYPWQGGGTIPDERSEETLELFTEYYELTQTDYYMSDDRLSRIHSADIEELHFNQMLVDSFIAIVKNFQAFSDHVEVVMLPKNTDWIKNPPEALERQRAVVERIQRETGVTFRDFQEIDAVTNDLFRDTTHLNRYQGAVVFTDFIVETYAPILSDIR